MDIKDATHNWNFRARAQQTNTSSRPHQQEISTEFAFHQRHLAGQKNKSNCCSHGTRFSEATCGFRRRDVVNNALYSGARKTPHCGCKPFGSYPHSYFCSCIMILWKIFQFCSFVTTLLTNSVHASRSSGRIFNVVHATHSSERVLDD